MYTVTQTYLDAIKAPAQEHDLFGELGNDYFSKDNIVSGTFHIQNQCTATDDVVLGSVYAGTLTATFHGITHIGRYDWVGQQIKPIFAIKNAHDVWEQVPLGIFTIKEAKHTAEGVEVTAYDNMIKFDRKFDAKYFRTAKKMYGYITDVCGICGVHFGMTEQEVQALPNGNTKIGIVGTKSNKELKEFGNDVDTYRDLVFWMAQTMACFATINRDGELVFRQYKDGEDTDDEVTEDYRLAGAEFDDFVTNYTGIYVKNTKSGNDIYYGYDVAALQQEITETENKIAGYEEYLDEAAEKYAHGEITEAEYRRIVKNLEKKTKQAETRLQWLEDALVKAQNGEDGLFMDLGENPFLQPDGIGTQYPEMRRRILNALDVISYTPFSCSTVFGVHYDLGDIIQFTGGHATSIGETCCLMAYDYTFNGEYVMQGFGSDPSKPVIKEKTAKSANKADKNGVSGGRTSVGSSVPTEGSEGDVHFTTGAGIDDEIIQTDNIHPQSTTQHPIRLYDFTGDYSSGYDFKVDGNPDGYGNGETIRIDVEGLEVGGQYHVEFDMQFTRADGGWMSSYSLYDKVSFCGSEINFTPDRNLHHYSGDFTYTENGQAVLMFYKVYDNYNFTAVFSNMVFTPADDSISGASVYHNDAWKNVDYVRKVTQVVTSGTQVATAKNSDGTDTGIYVPNMSGASASAAGSNGLVPAPASGDESKFLRGDGTWQNAGGGGSDLELEIDNGEIVATYGAQTEETEPILKDSTGDDIVTMLEAIATEMGALASPEIYAPVIYSLEEREIGVWTDGKPLYQITITNNSGISSVDQWLEIADIGNTKNIIDVDGKIITPVGEVPFNYNGEGSNISYITNMSASVVKALGKITARLSNGANWLRNNPIVMSIQYTKTTDVAGSGPYAALGVPAVHYDDTERVIGTWFGETLYQKTFLIQNVTVPSNSFVLYHPSDYISNIKENVKVECVAKNNKVVLPLLYANSQYAQYNLDIGLFGNDLYISRGGGGNFTDDFYVTLKYTKTS